MNLEKVKEFWAKEWDKRIDVDTDKLIFNEQKRKRIHHFLKRFNLNGEKILDVGCGVGQFNIEFKWKNWTGVDLSETAIQYGKSKRPESNYMLMDVLDLPEDKKFDVFMAWDSLEHIDLTMELANKIDRLSHKGSFFIGNVPTQYFTEAEECEHEMNYEILHRFLINCGYFTISTTTHYSKGSVVGKNGKTKRMLYPFLLFNSYRVF